MTLHGCSLLDNAGAYCPDARYSLLGQVFYSERGLHLINTWSFTSLTGVAVATTPKGRRAAAPPLGTPAAPNSAEHSITN